MEVRTLADADAAVAVIEHRGSRYHGSSKRHPGDKPNELIGLLLAEARAARRLADALEQRAWNLIEKDPTPSAIFPSFVFSQPSRSAGKQAWFQYMWPTDYEKGDADG